MGNFFPNTMMMMMRRRNTNTPFEDCFDGALPTDLMLEILKRLPLKTLMRFVSVSKSWHSAILSPAFTEKHQLYHQHKVIRFLHRYEDIKKGVCLISNKTDDHGGIIETRTTDIPLPFAVEDLSSLFDSYFNKVCFVGCSNGLVCIRLCETNFFYHERTRFGFWNPATRQFKLLSTPNIAMYGLPDDDHQLLGCIDGFSYVPRIRDYKVVRILVFKNKRSDNNKRYLGRALMLNMATKSWRELSYQELPCTDLDHNVVVVNGCLHVLVFRPEGGDQASSSNDHASLLSFDLDKERFRHTSVVPYLCNHLNCVRNKCWRMLTLFNENLAMFVCPKFRAPEEGGDEGLGNFFELWVWNGSTRSWSKKYSFGPLSRRSFPLGFLSNGKIIVRKNYDYRRPSETSSSSVDAYLYNPFNKEKSVIPCREKKECSLAFHSYVESFVQI